MGVTISSKNFSADLGYGGFNRFREKVAMLTSAEFGKHYAKLSDSICIFSEDDRKNFFKEYDAQTEEMVARNIVSVEIANFCFQPDCDGRIRRKQVKQIYEKIKDYDDTICYGYSGRSDCAMFKDLKNIIQDCAENGGVVEWR